jgi:hypothetical protein
MTNIHWLPIKIFTLAFLVVFLLFAWQGNVGFDLNDEGYLWYGVQRVMLGELPIRDFMSYDPGRYYWSAMFMELFDNNGIMTLRGAVAIFQTIGLFIGLLLIARTAKELNLQSFLYLLISAGTLVLWMFPRHKLFDMSLSILLIWILTFLIQNPSGKRYFFTGVFIGIVAMFGRNHGMYGAFGSFGVMLWLSINRTNDLNFFKGFILWALGVVVGFSPVLLMALLLPGFDSAFLESIRFIFEIKATNIPLPIPWPWLVDFSAVSHGEAIRKLLVGLFFVSILVFTGLSIAWVVWKRFRNQQVFPVLVAAAFLSLPYAHYAYSRADVGHLSHGIFPFLVGSLVLLATKPVKIKWPLALVLFLTSLWVTHIYYPGWQCYKNDNCVYIEVSNNQLKVDPSIASAVKLLRELEYQYAPRGQSFIVAPFWPGAYALLERKSPMWEIYALFPRHAVFEQAEIERIKSASPLFAFVLDLPLDGRDELRFVNTHPLTHQYLIENFELLQDLPNPAYKIYKSKKVAQ